MCGFDEMHGSGIIILGNNETILETKMICDGYSQDEEECLVREIINNCLTYGFPIVIKPDRNLSHEGILYKHGKQFYFPKYKKTEYKEFIMYLPIKNNKGVKIKDKMIVKLVKYTDISSNNICLENPPIYNNHRNEFIKDIMNGIELSELNENYYRRDVDYEKNN